jgi:hypothetical protein
VITLAYGLGFGMVLVLLVVPALMAAQADIGRAFRSLRRGTMAPQRMGGVVAGLVGAVLALFAATLGWAMVTGVCRCAGVDALRWRRCGRQRCCSGRGRRADGRALAWGAIRLRAPGSR